MFVGGHFDPDLVHGQSQSGGDILLHRSKMGRKLRLLRNNRRINIDDLSTPRRGRAPDLLQKNAAGCALPARIGIRKEMADVQFTERPEDRVADRVYQHVRIRMSFQPLCIRHIHSANKELSPCHQRMNIVSNTNSNHRATIRFAFPTTKSFVASLDLRPSTQQSNNPSIH
jgi:hypothetical protein